QGANVAIPLADAEEVSQRLENTLYGYFISKRFAFTLVETHEWVLLFLICYAGGWKKFTLRIMFVMQSKIKGQALFLIRFKMFNLASWNIRGMKQTPIKGVSGFWMFKVVKRLKMLKKPIRKLIYDHENLYENFKKPRHELDQVQTALDLDPSNFELQEEEVPLAFINHYLEFLGQQGVTFHLNSTELFCNKLTSDVSNYMVRDVSHQEICEAMFVMGDNKAPGTDGYTPGRRISDNILWTQELMHNYHLDRARVIMDTLEEFKEASGLTSSLPKSTAYFCNVFNYIKLDILNILPLEEGKLLVKYLGVPLVPSEVLTLMLHRMARVSGSFTYHQYSSKLNLINICFVDDFFLFPHGDVDSARVIMDTLEEFKEASGLTSSLPKSTAYFCNVFNYIKLNILNILPLKEGKLLVKYLGVPLVPSHLLYRYCKELMEKVKGRISD
nr:hypothetical protein [Tanacetum cinerariifolium]